MADKFDQYKSWAMNFLGDNIWIIQVFVIVFITLIVHVFSKRVLEKMEQKFETRKSVV